MLIMQSQSPLIFADRVRLPVTFDGDRLAEDLDRIAGATWVDHFVKQNYDGDWSVLPLRYSAGATHPIMQAYSDPSATEYAYSPLLDTAPAIRAAIDWFKCDLQTVRLMRLTPGSIIKEHFDYDLAAEWGTARIHIPITTNPQVEFMVNRVPVAMAPGDAWYLRLSDPHSVANRGTTDRVHLVIDCITNDWLTEQLTLAS
jgi:hypothetical protein